MSQPLVVMDTKALLYSRRIGKTKTHAIRADSALYPEEVERFRADPDGFIATGLDGYDERQPPTEAA